MTARDMLDAMTPRRIETGPLLALSGAVLLLISLFLAWFEPGLEAWDIFEVVDLILAAVAVAAILAALGMMVDLPSAPDARILPWLAAIALVLVVATIFDRPPAVGDEGDRDVGLWLALAGAALMAAGTLLGFARVSIAFDVQGRERRQRVAAVDARDAAPTEPVAPTGPGATSGPGATPGPGATSGPGAASGLFAGGKTTPDPTEPLPPTEGKPAP